MVNADGAAATARVLLRTDKFHEGLERLRQLDALGRSIEARALETRWQALFTDADRATARRRLKAMGHPEIGEHLEPSLPNRLYERLVVPLVLIGVLNRELSDRVVEH
jgi:hypothetical protein